MFVTFEGGEGAGKTTQIRLAAETLAAAGHPVLLTREPGGTARAEAVRRLLLQTDGWDAMTETLLLFAGRREHAAGSIRPALAAGITVLCDRFVDSTLVYQGYVKAGGLGFIRDLAQATLDGLRPSLTIILDIDPAIGLARAQARGDANRFEQEGIAFHRAVRAGFRLIAAEEPARCVVIDADRAPEAVAADVMAAILAAEAAASSGAAA